MDKMYQYLNTVKHIETVMAKKIRKNFLSMPHEK